MKVLVIHPSDNTTDFLNVVYLNKLWTVINNDISKRNLKYLIKQHERIIMLGHGSENGLLGFDNYIIDESFVKLLKTKECVFIWCHAHEFIEKYNLSGFHINMFISEDDEACLYGIMPVGITESNELFAKLLGKYIDSVNYLELIKEEYLPINEVTIFNRNNFYN